MGRNVQRLAQRLIGRLPASSSGLGLTEDSEKTRPASAKIRLEVGEPATSRFGCFRGATGPNQNNGQLGTAARDHLPIIESDVDFERFTEIGNCRFPSFKTSLGSRTVR